jgi:hypothetical protein
MAAEDIGSIYNVKVPGMDDAADIQEAFKLYHYGSLTYNKNNSDKTLLPVDSVAYHLNGLQVQITTNANNIELRIPKTLIDAKGDLIVGQFDNMPGKLSAGSDGQILTVNSASTLGLEWTSLPALVLNRTANAQNSDYTIADSDLNKILILSNVGASTITIGSTTMPIGTMIPVAILPAAFISVPPESLITFAGSSGVNVLAGYNKTLNAQYYGLVYLTKVASNGWLVTGDLVPTDVPSFSVFTFTPPSFSFTPPAFSFTPVSFSVFTFTPAFSVFSFTPTAFSFTPPAFSFTPPAFSFTPVPAGCGDCENYGDTVIEPTCNGEDSYEGIYQPRRKLCDGVYQNCTPVFVGFGDLLEANVVGCGGSGTFSFTPTPAFSFTPTPQTCTPTSYNENRICNGVATPVTIYVAADCTETWDCPAAFSFTPPAFSFTPFSVFSFSGAFSFTPFSVFTFTPPPQTCTPTSYNENRICNGVATPVTIYVAADCTETWDCPAAFSFTPPAFSFTPFSVFSFSAAGGFAPFSVFSFTPTSAFSVFSFTPPFSVFSFTPTTFSVFSFSTISFSFTPPAFSFTPPAFSFTPVPGGCVAGTTLVRTVGPDDTIVLKPASEVVVGEEIWSPTFDQLIDESLGQTYLWNATEITGLTLVKSSVANITPSEKSVMTINNDGDMRFSREQTILVKRNGTYSFIMTGLLEVGDILFKINEFGTGFDELPVTSIELIDGFETVYKFDAEPTDLLVAGGLALHNLKAY